MDTAPRGLKGVIVAETIARRRPGRGGLLPLPRVLRRPSSRSTARSRTSGSSWSTARCPTPTAARGSRRSTARLRALPATARRRSCRRSRPATRTLAALRTAVSHLAGVETMPAVSTPMRRRCGRTCSGSAAVAPLVAAVHRLVAGLAPVAPRDDLGDAANYLCMLTASSPTPTRARALEQYLVLTIDHGFNASTFTARVVTSTGADVGSAIVAALGALCRARSTAAHRAGCSRCSTPSGRPTASSPGSPTRSRRASASWASVTPCTGPPIPARCCCARSPSVSAVPLVDFADEVEATVERLLADLKPDRELHANVEFYAGVVMELCGLPRELFTPDVRREPNRRVGRAGRGAGAGSRDHPAECPVRRPATPRAGPGRAVGRHDASMESRR